jgi:predicted hydrocarbon binding protein
MERKDFFKSACTYGLCGCFGMSFLAGNSILANSKIKKSEEKSDWRLDFMQDRYRDLIYILNDTVDKDTLIGVLKQLGAKCGEYFANKYKNDPEGFFAYIKSNWAESVDYDKEKGIVTVNEKVRDTCNCPFIRKKDAPAILCNCSLGTQKKIYESLFSRPVSVTLNKSVLRGDERCSFTMQLL